MQLKINPQVIEQAIKLMKKAKIRAKHANNAAYVINTFEEALEQMMKPSEPPEKE